MGYSECSKAEVLRKGLKGIHAGNQFMQQVVLPGVIGFSGVIAALGTFMRPQGPGDGDYNMGDRIANVITSVPFMLVGCHTMRKRTSCRGKLYGASLVGVGAASMTFHGSKGRLRRFARKMDYWTIAVSTACMNSAVFPKVHPLFWVAQLAIIPFRPFQISSANTSAMEIEYLRRSRKNPKLQRDQLIHSSTCALGMGCWCYEDCKPKTPFVHSVWHLLACASCATTNGLLAEVEENLQAAMQPAMAC